MTVSTFILVPGAGGDGRYWDLVVPLLREAGHDAVAADLPAGQDGAGLTAYADTIAGAIADGRDPDAPFDRHETFLHDVPPDVARRLLAGGGGGDEGLAFEEPWPLDAWPGVPTSVIAGARDRLFPLEFMRGLARDRLGIGEVAVLDSGHLPALSRPEDLARLLLDGR